MLGRPDMETSGERRASARTTACASNPLFPHRLWCVRIAVFQLEWRAECNFIRPFCKFWLGKFWGRRREAERVQVAKIRWKGGS